MSSNNDATWTSWFCSLRGNEFFCEVDEDYITSQTNLYGLREQVPRYHDALSMILNVGTEPTEFTDQVEQAAEMLYGLIHVRYILSKHGLHKMLGKYESGDFGRCSRVYCNSQAMLPIGLSDIPGEAMVKAYCPKCKEVYTPTASRHRLIDGAHFGTGFPDMMFMVYPEKRPARPESFVPRLFGFRIHP